MAELGIERRMNARRWDTNKRTIPRSRRVAEDILDRAAALKDEGRFSEAVSLLQAQAADALSADATALNGLGHSLLGDGRLEEALTSYKAAEQAAQRDLAKALVNQATVFKTLKRYDDALEVIGRARDLEPTWFVPYLTLIAIYEWRAGAEDRDAAANGCKALTANCLGWEDNAELWRYLLTDMDYARLRSDTIFSNIFGMDAETAQRRLNNGA